MEEKNKSKRNKKLDIFLKVVAFVYVVITIIFYISVVKLNLLPGIYITIFTMAEIFFTLAMVIGLVKEHKTPKLNIICLFIILLLSGVYIFVTNYTLATGNFLDNVFQENAQTEEYYLVVKKDSKYEKIEDIAKQNVYLFQVPNDVQQEVQGKGNISLVVAKNGLTELGKNLINNTVKVIFVSSVQYDILGEEIEKFKDDTKILYTAKHEIKATVKVEDEESKYNIQNGIFNVYISGIDTEGNISNVARSDANIIATINTNTHEVLLTSVPRDYYVTLHSYGAKDKLTHSGIYGINETVKTVEDLMGIDINYYVRVNFTTVRKLVDTLGGVDVYSDYSFTSYTYSYQKGYNHMNGAQALEFSRERYSFADGDNQRVKNQQHVMEAIIKKVLNSNTILTKYTNILNSLEGSFQTNIKQSEISSLVKGQLNNMSSWTIKTNSLTGTGVNNTTYSMGSQLLYTMVPDRTSVSEAKQKIKDIMEK
ncbi:MAG: LCP family protein [Clostridia bacterium]|jgi:LCP family protein required for cell wall assembly|nr:LCP family protein [Clostridia bacterium]